MGQFDSAVPEIKPTHSEGESARREAKSGSSFHLNSMRTGGSPARSGRVRVIATWRCNHGASGRTFTTTAGGTHTVANPELGCPNDGLHEHTVTTVAFDPNRAVSTGELTINTFGLQFDEDRLPILGPS